MLLQLGCAGIARESPARAPSSEVLILLVAQQPHLSLPGSLRLVLRQPLPEQVRCRSMHCVISLDIFLRRRACIAWAQVAHEARGD